jgi:ABC-type branched-subunit amino acid transport system permease subunit
MLGSAGLVAVLIAGRPLLEARRTPDQVLPASSVVALLTAAYAALAVLAVTFLAGYPLTWGTALITFSIVCLGALLTARVVAAAADDAADGDDPATAPAPDGRPGFSGRRFISLAGGAVVVLLAVPARACRSCRQSRRPPEAAHGGWSAPERPCRWQICAVPAARCMAAPDGDICSPLRRPR